MYHCSWFFCMSGKLKIDNHFQDIAEVKKDGNFNLD